MLVDPSNTEQLRAWDGGQGEFWTRRADRFDAGVARYREHFFAAAAIEPDSTVLDVGCGAGQVTRDAARQAKSGLALGVDLSAPMLALARELAGRENLPNAVFGQLDAQVHPFAEHAFDRVVSRHGAMFFGDAPAAFANLARALRPGGLLTLLSWQPMPRNEWMRTFRTAFANGVEPTTPPPTAGGLTDPDLTRDLLSTAGFTDIAVDPVSEQMWFGRDVPDALEFITEQFGWIMREQDADTQARIVETVRADLAAHLAEDGVRYGSAAYLVRARRP
ncbi:class I SAM-dependent methyltransferase [Crossiella sp. CA198]|uniref:class I SAM-dependent methyltransferase n=1 Tax=Crossiella sp. CA198 TaxID=3455607 RepID=UPI003F8D757A